MARYPGARWLPIPETNSQARIAPTQFICHSVIAPWGEDRIRQFWNEAGVNVESHFGLDYDGSIGQYIDTSVRADANTTANNRAISIETASNSAGSDRWTAAQAATLVALMKWASVTHHIPLRICRTSTDPGFGIHNMFASWSGGGTACPGAARSLQFRNEIFPKLLGATGVTPPTGTTPGPSKPFLSVASVQPNKSGSAVKALQVALINKGFKIAAGPTGFHGPQTTTAYKAYQRSLGYAGSDADGRPGVSSLQKLLPKYKVV